ncbi:hypothetical protein Emed_004810 [Eimeria media]
MNVAEVQSFVSFWKDELNMQQQRCGFMFGYYREDSHYPQGIRAVCEAIYEPPQEGSAEGFRLLDSHDAELQKARAVAEALGLDLIGLIFTHKSREEFLTAQEAVFLAKLTFAADAAVVARGQILLLAASAAAVDAVGACVCGCVDWVGLLASRSWMFRLQLKYLQSGHFTGYPAPKFSAGETPEQQQDISPNAFMVSDLVMALVRDGLVAEEQTDPAHIILRKPAKVVHCAITSAANVGGVLLEEQRQLSLLLLRLHSRLQTVSECSHFAAAAAATLCQGELLPQVLEGGAERDSGYSVAAAAALLLLLLVLLLLLLRVQQQRLMQASLRLLLLLLLPTASGPAVVPAAAAAVAAAPSNSAATAAPQLLLLRLLLLLLQAYFNHPSVSRGGGAAGDSSSSSNWTRFSDFHLLLYVANLFDLPTSLTLCEAVAKEGQVDPGIEDVLKSLG